MRSRSSPKHTTTKCMDMEGPKESHLSGAYIGSLVKRLSSSRPKEQPPVSTPIPDSLQFSPSPSPPQTQPPKKQVRRRLHPRRPYQERLLNMAEARRDIVTALKIHRASMKQSSQQNPQNTHSISSLQSPPQQDIDPNPSNVYQPYPSLFWPHPQISPLTINATLTLPLPLPLSNQPLGLKLNFQGFNNIDLPYTKNENKATSSSTTSYTSSSPPIMLPPPTALDPNGVKLHPVMDDEEMRQIRSISEQHDMEWNDTMNLVTTAWWSKMLQGNEERDVLFDEAADVPA